jgi:type IV secretory pathway protease TraF
MTSSGVGLVAAAALAAGVAVWAVARPLRYEVEGVSMAPGLMPGDVVATSAFPAVTGLRGPRRFERWLLVPPGGGDAIKRVVGLPGETIALVDGDLAVDGSIVVTPPRVLAETAVTVPPAAATDDAASAADHCHRTVAARVVLDDIDFAPEERRLLLPVRDVGLAALVRAHGHSAAAPRLRMRVGAAVVAWRLPSAGAFAAVAGRLDGRFVAACWQVSTAECRNAGPRERLPPGIPEDWQVVRPWPASAAEPGDPWAGPCGVWIGCPATPGWDDEGRDCDPRAGEIVSCSLWRDVLHRPAADGRDEWRLGRDEFFVLGDFPSGSRDSRHWGPVQRGVLRAAVTGPR